MSFLRSLSNQQILSRIEELVRRERSLTRDVLLHLNEIERRRLHLELGFASMFDYCTTGLGYSSSAAARRIRTARCIARYPEVLALLESNAVNLSTVSQVSRVLNSENKQTLLQRIRGKSQREVDAIIAEYEPRSLPKEQVRPVVVLVPAAVAAARPSARATAAGVGASALLGGITQAVATPAHTGTAAHSEESIPAYACGEHCRSGSELSPSVVTERRMLLSFSASEAFMAKLEKIKSLAWHRLPANSTLEQVFELAMDHFIDGEDPAARRERREMRHKRKSKMNKGASSKRPPRHVAAAVRDDVTTRDKGRCTYVGSNGRRCSSTRALQIDHVQPVARGGGGRCENLRLLCAYHNRLEAERILGSCGRPAH